MSDDDDRLRELEKQMAVTQSEIRHLKNEIQKLTGGLGRVLWLIGGGIIASAVSWLLRGGLQ